MLFKLLSSSMKKMWKDYLVLLFGLTISIAIFYMFQTLAQNKTFLEENALISNCVRLPCGFIYPSDCHDILYFLCYFVYFVIKTKRAWNVYDLRS